MKYIIDIPTEMAEATAEYWNKTTDMTLVPYTEIDRKGIEDEVWELARRIICPSDCCKNSISAHTKEIFNKEEWEIRGIFNDLSYQEAKDKYEKWKKKKKEILVGDEIEAEPGNKACVLYENPDGTNVFVFKANGTAGWWSKCAIHKTGKNHPEVAELLKKMR